MRLIAIPAVLVAAVLSASGAFAACNGKAGRSTDGAKGKCKELAFERPKRFEPYDSTRMRAGGRPGFIDVGGGTEVRIGGRVRTEFQYTR